MKLTTTMALTGLLVLPGATASAASFTALAKSTGANGVSIEHVQYRPRGYGAGPRYAPRIVAGPRFYAPRGYAGRPYWAARPWAARPYYGRIFAGVALGTIVTAAAIGYAPRRPDPNLCWYWADSDGQRGYWDYCQ